MTAPSLIDAAYDELVAKHGPPPGSGMGRRQWFARHADERREIVARLRNGDPAPDGPMPLPFAQIIEEAGRPAAALDTPEVVSAASGEPAPTTQEN